MQVFNAADAHGYFQHLGIKPWGKNPYEDNGNQSTAHRYRIPKEGRRNIVLCRMFNDVFGFDVGIVWPTDSLLDEFGSLTKVYIAYLRSLGVEAPDKVVAIRFEDGEQESFGDALAISVLSGWDTFAFSTTTKRIVHFSHDDFLEVCSPDASDLVQMSRQVSEFGLESMPWGEKKIASSE